MHTYFFFIQNLQNFILSFLLSFENAYNTIYYKYIHDNAGHKRHLFCIMIHRFTINNRVHKLKRFLRYSKDCFVCKMLKRKIITWDRDKIMLLGATAARSQYHKCSLTCLWKAHKIYNTDLLLNRHQIAILNFLIPAKRHALVYFTIRVIHLHVCKPMSFSAKHRFNGL